MQLKVSAEALETELLCGNQVATVPKTGQMDTVVRTLLVEVGNSGPVSARRAGVAANAALCVRRLRGRRRWSATTLCSALQVGARAGVRVVPGPAGFSRSDLCCPCFRRTQREEGLPAAARVLRGRIGPGLRLRAGSAQAAGLWGAPLGDPAWPDPASAALQGT